MKISPFHIGRIYLLALVLCISYSCSGDHSRAETQSWQLVYQNDFNGNSINGNVKDLVTLIKKGSPIRVSWGGTEADGRSWIEFAEPVFTTVMNDTAVVVQFPLSFIQTHYTDPENTFLQTDRPTGWRAIMSTTGKYHQFHYNLESGEITKEMYSRTNMSWFALTSSKDNRSAPDLAPKNAFKLDSLIEK